MCQYTRPTATPPRPATVQPPRSTDAPRRHTSTPPIGVTRHRPRGGIWPSPRNAQRQRPFPVVSWMATGLAPAGLRLFPPQWVRLLKSIKNKLDVDVEGNGIASQNDCGPTTSRILS